MFIRLMILAVFSMAMFVVRADLAYRVEINHIEKGVTAETAGKVPSDISLQLKDTKTGTIHVTDSVDFSSDTRLRAYIGSDGRLDLATAYTQLGGNFSVNTKNGKTVSVSEDGNKGLMIVWNHTFNNSSDVFGKDQMTDAQMAEYASDNLRTILTAAVDGKTAKDYSLVAAYNYLGATQIGSQAELRYVPVPEPTSALLTMLGFAGLALRRRRMV